LYNPNRRYPFPYRDNVPIGNPRYMNNDNRVYPYTYGDHVPVGDPRYMNNDNMAFPYTYRNNNMNTQYSRFADHGPEPFVVNIENVTKRNDTFRTALWTGESFAAYVDEH
jgi:hypothetical protein